MAAQHTRIDENINALIASMENLKGRRDGSDQNALHNLFEQQQAGQTLIRSCEDLLALTRELKERWLLGTLNTLRKSDEKADEDAREVVRLVGELVNKP